MDVVDVRVQYITRYKNDLKTDFNFQNDKVDSNDHKSFHLLESIKSELIQFEEGGKLCQII